MPKRPCLGVDGQHCTNLTDRPDSRCTACATAWNRARDAHRGSTAQRGYGTKHQAARARMLPSALGQLCPRCGQPMQAGQELDAGHSTGLRLDPTSRADRIEHSACNRGARD